MLGPTLTDAIGYDDIDGRESLRESGVYLLGELIVNDLKQRQVRVAPDVLAVKAAEQAAEMESECEVCHTPLLPASLDDNHHCSVSIPVHHFCAQHCPACKNSPVPRQDEEFHEWLQRLFGITLTDQQRAMLRAIYNPEELSELGIDADEDGESDSGVSSVMYGLGSADFLASLFGDKPEDDDEDDDDDEDEEDDEDDEDVDDNPSDNGWIWS